MKAMLSKIFRGSADAPPPFDPVEFVLDRVGGLVRRKAPENRDLMRAYSDFADALRVPSPIYAYIQERLDPDQPQAGLYQDEIIAFGNALLFAVSFAPTRISDCVAKLFALGYYAQGALIARNLSVEVGHDREDAHIKLLFNSLNGLDFRLMPGHDTGRGMMNGHFLGSMSYELAQAICFLREKTADPDFLSCDVTDRDAVLAAYREFETSMRRCLPNYAGLLYPIHEVERGDQGRQYSFGTVTPFGRALSALDTLPRDVGHLAWVHSAYAPSRFARGQEPEAITAMLHHTALEMDAARKSHIWAYQKMVDSYAGWIEPGVRPAVMKWGHAHISADSGVEEDHVREAVESLVYVMKCHHELDIAAGLDYAAEIFTARNRHWENVVSVMKDLREGALDRGDHVLPVCPVSGTNKVEKALTFIRSLV